MKGYKTIKTTMGHKIRVRMTEEEIADQEIFHMVLFLLPSLAFCLFAAVWLSMR